MSRADEYKHLKRLYEAFSEPCADTLYHYTSADGISGIVDKHEIWMSNTAFMDDPTELTALENASSLLKPDDFKHDAVKEEWRRMVSGARLNGIRELNYYMASFSRRKDSLEQWRGYGNFCIGLDARKLKLKLRRHISLYECLYTPADIRKW